MSKQNLKLLLSKMSNDEMTEFICDLYSNSKICKDYIGHFLNPENAIDALEKYKKVIEKEFYPKNPNLATLKFSVAKKAIKEFSDLKPDPLYLGELMLYLPELASKYTHDNGDVTEQFYTSTENNFKKALEYISKHGLLEHFKVQISRCVEYSLPCGYGFNEAMNDIYDTYNVD